MSEPKSAGLAHQLVLGATDELSRAEELLAQPAPQNLDIACSPLTKAIAHVASLQALPSMSPSLDLKAALAGLRRELELVSRLLENAAGYHVSLIRCMLDASYAPMPQTSRTESSRRLSLDA